MDKITLTEKGEVFISKYAAVSVLTGRFVACIIDSDIDTIRKAFTNPGTILVHNVQNLYADTVYNGFNNINEIREETGQTIIILDKGDEQ